MSGIPPIDFGEIDKNADSVRVVFLEFFEQIADFWEPGIEYSASTFVRPVRSTGFSYEATTGGQSKSREPKWPTTLSATVTDGQVVWTARAAGTNAVNTLSSPSAAVVPTGQLTLGTPTAVDGLATNSRIQLSLTGGSAGSCYTVSVTVTSGSQTLVGVFRVNVK